LIYFRFVLSFFTRPLQLSAPDVGLTMYTSSHNMKFILYYRKARLLWCFGGPVLKRMHLFFSFSWTTYVFCMNIVHVPPHTLMFLMQLVHGTAITFLKDILVIHSIFY